VSRRAVLTLVGVLITALCAVADAAGFARHADLLAWAFPAALTVSGLAAATRRPFGDVAQNASQTLLVTFGVGPVVALLLVAVPAAVQAQGQVGTCTNDSADIACSGAVGVVLLLGGFVGIPVAVLSFFCLRWWRSVEQDRRVTPPTALVRFAALIPVLCAWPVAGLAYAAAREHFQPPAPQGVERPLAAIACSDTSPGIRQCTSTSAVIAAAGPQGALLLWPSGGTLAGELIDATGRVPVSVPDVRFGLEQEAAIAPLQDGRFAIVWENGTAPHPVDAEPPSGPIEATYIDADGTTGRTVTVLPAREFTGLSGLALAPAGGRLLLFTLDQRSPVTVTERLRVLPLNPDLTAEGSLVDADVPALADDDSLRALPIAGATTADTVAVQLGDESSSDTHVLSFDSGGALLADSRSQMLVPAWPFDRVRAAAPGSVVVAAAAVPGVGTFTVGLTEEDSISATLVHGPGLSADGWDAANNLYPQTLLLTPHGLYLLAMLAGTGSPTARWVTVRVPVAKPR
jgi:hypothetical protein